MQIKIWIYIVKRNIQIIERKTDNGIFRWKCTTELGTGMNNVAELK